VLEVKNLSRRFGALRAVDRLTFSARTGTITALIGPNGAGKSTAFNLISGAVRPDEGQVGWHGEDITGLSPQRLRALGVARSFQITNLFAGLTVFENVRLAALAALPGPRLLQSLRRLQEPRARATEVLDQFGLLSCADMLAGTLSHGDQRRLEIAVCMAWQPQLLMLDEPTQGMSPAETASTESLIKSLAGQVTVLIVEHDVDLVMNLSDHIVVMRQGTKIAEGSPVEVRSSDLAQQAYLGGQVDAAA
jgi:branched-chain amino acid transport system ATP-binding protein